MSADREVVSLEPVDSDDDLDIQIETALTGSSQDVLDELQDLHDQDKLDPESIAQRAQDPGSALHRVIFAEDDATAAWRRRIELAQALVRRVKIVTIQVRVTSVEGGGTRTTKVKVGEARAFTSIRGEDGRHHYRETRKALAEDREQVVAMLDREVRGMVNRRLSILSLDEIEQAIVETIKAIRAGE